MNIFSQIMSQPELAKDLGLLFIRVGIGAIFARHGFQKVMAGAETWQWLGMQMGNIGITFAPLFWGFLAACTEFLGGICLMLGIATRFVSFFLACVMVIAIAMHFTVGDSYRVFSHPLSLLVVFIGLMIAGSDKYTLGALFYGK